MPGYRDDDIDWMKAPCWRCDNVSECETRCGPLCTACLNEYRSEYVDYKSTMSYIVQKSLRRRFADKWFCGEMDESHEWSMHQLTKTRETPGFRQKTFDAGRNAMKARAWRDVSRPTSLRSP